MAAFAEGDLVQLKSGGPSMVVRSVPTVNGGDYWCSWFKGASKERSTFSENELQPFVSPKAPTAAPPAKPVP